MSYAVESIKQEIQVIRDEKQLELITEGYSDRWIRLSEREQSLYRILGMVVYDLR